MQILRGSRISTTTAYLQLLKSRYEPALSLFYFCRYWLVRMIDIVPDEKKLLKHMSFILTLKRWGIHGLKSTNRNWQRNRIAIGFAQC